MCFSRNINYNCYYYDDVGHDTLCYADEGTNPETAAVHRLIYKLYYIKD